MSEARDSFIWLNGALLPAKQARIDPSDRGLTLGDGLFETDPCGKRRAASRPASFGAVAAWRGTAWYHPPAR